MARVLTAAIGAPLVVAALFLFPPGGFVALVGGLCLIAAAELARLGRATGAGRGVYLLPVFVLLAAILLVDPAVVGFADRDSGLRILLLVLLVTAGASLAGLWSGGKVRARGLAASFLGFGALYLALPVAAFDQLRARDPWLVVLLLATVWLTDTGAFLIGSKWGRRKLAPEVSPNKSWEGAWGGLLLGLLAAGVCSWWRLGVLEPSWLFAGLVVSVSGQLGDLFESMFKRSAGVKDSGTLLPGHGGMLDRLDSLIVAAPVLELTCRLVLPAAS
ncbi:MAG: phosphatidate cytidylyltransferase [Acidobacteria bacterium]|nr:phosphatidate cytidylyltransferase [Acidobacteriota bacterium]